MSYSEFTLDILKERFAIKVVEDILLFPNIPIEEIPELLKEWLSRYLLLATNINTEKARSELIITPILAEFKHRYKDKISLYSGTEFSVDISAGLNGRCDYILSRSSEQLSLTSPIIMLVEAKNENIIGGIPQCIAEMIAAQKYNAQRGNPIEIIFGAVTTGSLWRFLKLEQQSAYVDIVEYPIQNLDKILGILTLIISQ